MNIIKKDISSGEFEFCCPYCNEIIFAVMDDVINGSCEHLLFSFSDDSHEFIEANDKILEMYEAAGGSSEDGLFFEDFIEVLEEDPYTSNSTGVKLIDTYDSVWFWFNPSLR